MDTLQKIIQSKFILKGTHTQAQTHIHTEKPITNVKSFFARL